MNDAIHTDVRHETSTVSAILTFELQRVAEQLDSTARECGTVEMVEVQSQQPNKQWVPELTNYRTKLHFNTMRTRASHEQKLVLWKAQEYQLVSAAADADSVGQKDIITAL